MNDSRTRWLLGLILAVGCVLRLTYLLEVRRAPDFDRPQFESQYHDYWARALVSGDWTPPAGVTDPEIPTRPYFRPPGYPWLLSLVYRTAGPGYLAPRILQMALGLLSCVLVFSLGRRIYGAGAGLFAAALAAVYWLFLFFEAEFMEPPLLIFLLLAALTIVAGWPERFTVRRALATGLLLGFATLVRPNAVVLAPALLLWIAWVRRRRNMDWRTGFPKPALVFLAAVLVTTLPATVRNALVADDVVWITSNAGVNFFVGSHPDGDGYTPGVPELGEITGLEGWDSFDYPKIAAAVERLAGRKMKDSEVSRFFTRRALRNVLDQPGRTLRLTARKLALFWGPAEVSNNKVLSAERRSSPTLSLGPDFATVLALAVTGLAFLVWRLRRTAVGPDERRRVVEGTMLLAVVVAVYSASFLPFFVAARFRAPLVPILTIFAGCGLSWAWDALRGLHWRRLGAAVALLIVLRAVTAIAWVPYQDDEALWHWRRGILWEARGELGSAIAEYRAALAADPRHGDARLALAAALAASGRPAEAVAEYRAALAVDPRSITAYNNLALLLAQTGDLAGAIRHWEAALALDPERLSVLGNLAFALATAEDPGVRDVARAVELAERGCQSTGFRDPRLLGALAVAYRAAGRDDEAEDLRRRAAELASPDAG